MKLKWGEKQEQSVEKWAVSVIAVNALPSCVQSEWKN